VEVFLVVGDTGADVVLHALDERGAALFAGLKVAIDPSGRLLIPHEAVAVQLHVILLCHADEAVAAAPVEIAFGAFDAFPFHGVVRHDAVEVLAGELAREGIGLGEAERDAAEEVVFEDVAKRGLVAEFLLLAAAEAAAKAAEAAAETSAEAAGHSTAEAAAETAAGHSAALGELGKSDNSGQRGQRRCDDERGT
jgi:hypothetical protein